MFGTENTKMSLVDRQDLRDIQSFSHGEDAGVDKVDLCIVVFSEDISRADIIFGCWILDYEPRNPQIIQELCNCLKT